MCAIFGTKSVEEYEELYELNHKRGGFAFSNCFINEQGEPIIVKKQSYNEPLCCARYMLAHDQAPTSSVRGYHFTTSHPFEVGNWIVAHNGVLTNHKSLLIEHFCPIDSSYIPMLLHNQIALENNGELNAISNVFSRLEGTFSCWIYNKESKHLYLVKQGSTLFSRFSTFSSVKYKDSNPLEDGVIYKVYTMADVIVEVGKFTSNNPFALI